MNNLEFLLDGQTEGTEGNEGTTGNEGTENNTPGTENHTHEYVEGKCSCGATEVKTPGPLDFLSTMGMPIMLILAMVAMWWFSSRSQKKRDKEAQEMRDALQIGDEVTTIGGIIGKVVSVKDETFVLETTKDRTHIRFLKAAIRSVDVRVADVAAAAEPKKDDQPAEEPKKKFGLFGKNKNQ